jgi:hypothetical protein
VSLYAWEIRKLVADPAARAGAIISAAASLLALAFFAFSKDASGVPLGSGAAWVFAAHVLLPAASCLLPPLLVVVLSGSISGEVESGTLDDMLVRPVARWRLVAVKTAAGATYAAALVGFALFVALALAPAIYGAGSLPIRRAAGAGEASAPAEAARPASAPAATEAESAGEARRDAALDAGAATGGTSDYSSVAAPFVIAGAYALLVPGLLAAVALAILISSAGSNARRSAVFAAGILVGLSALARATGAESTSAWAAVGGLEPWRVWVFGSVGWVSALAGLGALLVAFLAMSACSVIFLHNREFPPRA